MTLRINVIMRNCLRGFVLVLLCFPVFANTFAARDLVIPVIGRTPGTFGSEWRTDVVVTNLDETASILSLVFSTADNGVELDMLEIQPGQTMVFKDIVKTRFGADQALGWLRVSTPRAGAKLTAYARIYNTNATRGESSQVAPAIPVTMTGRDVVLSGLTGIDSHRTNIGFGSTEGPVAVTIRLLAPDGNGLKQTTVALRDSGVYQINDIFSWFSATPFEGASVHIASEKPIFAYASIVNNDTGDGYLLTGAARDRAANDVITPACSDPAPLNLVVHPAPGYIVIFHEGTDTAARVEELEQKYGFVAENVFFSIDAFYVRVLSAETIAALRCESDVRVVEQNAYSEFAGR